MTTPMPDSPSPETVAEAREALDEALLAIDVPAQYATPQEAVLARLTLGRAYISARDTFEQAVRAAALREALACVEGKRMENAPKFTEVAAYNRACDAIASALRTMGAGT